MHNKLNRTNIIKGFTLIEVMIVVAIIGILAAVAYPSYTEFVTKNNRAEALRELIHIANLQEQYYVDNRTYVRDMKSLGYGSTNWNTLESGLYRVKNTKDDGDTFRIRAQARGVQLTNDSACENMYIEDTGAKTPTVCWEL